MTCGGVITAGNIIQGGAEAQVATTNVIKRITVSSGTNGFSTFVEAPIFNALRRSVIKGQTREGRCVCCR